MNEIEMISKSVWELFCAHRSLIIIIFSVPVYGAIFRMFVSGVRRSLDLPTPTTNKTRQTKKVVGHVMTDDEKIQYIIDTDKDIESASDRIAEIYYKQMNK